MHYSPTCASVTPFWVQLLDNFHYHNFTLPGGQSINFQHYTASKLTFTDMTHTCKLLQFTWCRLSWCCIQGVQPIPNRAIVFDSETRMTCVFQFTKASVGWCLYREKLQWRTEKATKCSLCFEYFLNTPNIKHKSSWYNKRPSAIPLPVVAMLHFHLQFKYTATSGHLANDTLFTAQYSN